MNYFDLNHRKLNLLLKEGIDYLEDNYSIILSNDDDQQNLMDYWSDVDGAIYISVSPLDNRIFQDSETLASNKLRNLISPNTIKTYIDSDALVLVAVIGDRFDKIALGALDRENKVGAMTNFDWSEDRATELLDSNIEFVFNDSTDPVELKSSMNKLVALLQECRRWNLDYDRQP